MIGGTLVSENGLPLVHWYLSHWKLPYRMQGCFIRFSPSCVNNGLVQIYFRPWNQILGWLDFDLSSKSILNWSKYQEIYLELLLDVTFINNTHLNNFLMMHFLTSLPLDYFVFLSPSYLKKLLVIDNNHL